MTATDRHHLRREGGRSLNLISLPAIAEIGIVGSPAAIGSQRARGIGQPRDTPRTAADVDATSAEEI